ncbi:NuoM family protein [uncultured Microscilla sp.]|uniref:complex I subunit 4 family protein n=1 Tax=uncultured Microscilla sp. TaxID=432653 RepID=UPI002626EE52|nr:NADH-quinone oxidoreductase subunit M [uncultured Microscilla sp.]
MLSFIVLLPLLVCAILLFVPHRQAKLFKIATLLTTATQLSASCWAYFKFETGKKTAAISQEAAYQLVEKLEWIRLDLGSFGQLSIDYFIGVDGVSISMILLSAIVMFMGAIASWNIQQKQKGYFLLYLLLSSSVPGCFVALDFFLFYLFFEFMLLPMYFLIGIWGGVRREYASIKFFIYTLVGSLFILVVMIALYNATIDPAKTAVQLKLANETSQVTPEMVANVQQQLASNGIAAKDQVHTFSMLHMMDQSNYVTNAAIGVKSSASWWGYSLRFWAFLALFIGFAIKLPVVPVHTWLPDAHVEAPTAISVVLAGILLKVGGYGLIRIAYSIFPDMALSFAVITGFLGMLSIIYGALNALAMTDLKKMIAYSSVSHMGFVLIGLASFTAEGINGAVFQMFSHGILSALLFLLVGVLYDRTHDRSIGNYRGLLSKMPYYGVFVMIGFFASLGLPGFSGFIGELFTILGGFASPYLPVWIVVVSTFGIVLGAAYFLWTLQRMFLGKYWVKNDLEWSPQLQNLDPREWVMLVSLSLLALITGIFPGLLFQPLTDTVNELVNHLTTFMK